MKVERPDDVSIEITVERAKTLVGCEDLHVSLKRADDQTIEGHFANGGPVTLKRR